MGAMSAMAIGIATAAMTALSSFSQSQQQSQQQKAQASALQAQASATRKQAELTARKGRVEAENYDRQKSALRREFQETQGRNRSLLAAGNVDMGGGSALDVSLGNIERFAADVGENAYQKALKQWETAQEVKNIHYQAATLDAQGSYLKKTAGNLGTSLLTAGLSGLTAGMGTYSMAGGTFGGMGGSMGGAGGLPGTPPGTPGLPGASGSGLPFGTWSHTKKLSSITHPTTWGKGW